MSDYKVSWVNAYRNKNGCSLAAAVNAYKQHEAMASAGSHYSPANALILAAEKILSILDHPTQSVTMFDADDLRAAIAAAKADQS